MDKMHFTFSDTIAGYVTAAKDTSEGTFGLKTSDGREFQVKLTDVNLRGGDPQPDRAVPGPGRPYTELAHTWSLPVRLWGLLSRER